jgi:hypothetical protein
MHDFPLNNAGDGHRFVDLNSGETVTLTISQLNAVADAAHFHVERLERRYCGECQ